MSVRPGLGTIFPLLLLLVWLLGLPAVALGQEPVAIVVKGIEGRVLENVEAVLSLPSRLVQDGEVDRPWLDRFIRQIPQKIKPALEPFGYYSPSADTLLEIVGENRYRIHVSIDPGEPVRVSEASVRLEGEGAEHPALLELAGKFPLQPGDILRHETYEEGKGALQARALDLGFIDADWSRHEVRVTSASAQAEIDLLLATGPLYHFGDTRISGAEGYPDPFLRRYLAFRPGEVFTYPKLGQTQLNYLDSDRFREIVITPLLSEAQGAAVPVEVRLHGKPSRRLRPGIGYGTDTGARVSLRYKDVNSFDLGHELGGDLLLAEWKQTVEANYTVPSLTNIDSHTSFRLGYDRDVNETFTSAKTFAEVERVRGFGRGRIGSVYLRLLQEDFSIGLQQETSRMVLPGVRFSRRKFSDPVRPREGFSYSLEVRGGHQALGSDTGLLQGLVSANLLQPLPWKLALLARAQGGVTLQNERFAEVPASLRFFAGGDQSVRGYGYQTLGPKDVAGKVIGGKHLAVGSVELERALNPNWSAALFYDVGNAFNSPVELDWAMGAGVGVRRYTVVGPIKVDLARQLGESKPSYRLHISIGFGW